MSKWENEKRGDETRHERWAVGYLTVDENKGLRKWDRRERNKGTRWLDHWILCKEINKVAGRNWQNFMVAQ